ncbi:AEC family transporter [Pontibacterium sp. N1Y112]|uniref:AEC family transporter n=1 Tax=Pontibacterium sinense TaxID=2781979 RepID=A0A8J7FEX1_9GAMM|nr:AEC family transporter [Pontibacterium sinense]MBE9398134.1 AEC family transporter [Pontibacterium sinense]
MELYLQSLAFTANTVAPIFFIVFLGIVLKRIGLIDAPFVSTASRLVFTLTLPALVFMAISGTNFQSVFNPDQLIYFVGATLSSFVLLWWLAARWIKDGRDLGAFIQGAFRGNYGIIGLAVSYNLFADSGLAQASILLAMVIPLYNVLSIFALTLPLHKEGGLKFSSALLEIIKNPLILAVLFALPFSFMGWTLPEVVEKTGRYFANLTLPLALLAIGGSLSIKSLKDTSAMAFWATSTKLVILPVGLSIGAWIYGFRGQDLAMLFILFGCPTAAASFVMAKATGANGELAANIILTTTLGSVLSLSAGIYLLRVWGVI